MVNTLILCDKSNSERTNLTTVFRARGFDVIGVNTTFDMLVKAKKYDPDLVVVSFSNAEQDYLDSIKSIKLNDKLSHLPVLIIFNQDNPALNEIISDARKADVDGVLLRPFDYNFGVQILKDIQKCKGNAGKKKILIADDHPAIRDALAFSFSKEGFNVFIAENGREAYEKARFLVPDLIVMDYSMPECNGLYAAKRIKELLYMKETPIIGHTAVVTQELISKSLACGFASIIKKPTPVADIVVKVKSLL